MRIVAECRNALEALEWLAGHPVDLMFLDIRMPKLTGIEMIKTLKHPPAVILVTAYREYAVEGFDLDVVDYLLKPVSFERCLRAVNRYFNARKKMEVSINRTPETMPGEPFIYVSVQKRMVRIYLSEIRFIESIRDYVRIHLGSKQIVTRMRIGALADSLPRATFLRIHKSFIIGIRHIRSVNAQQVEIGEKILPIGRSYRKWVQKCLRVNT